MSPLFIDPGLLTRRVRIERDVATEDAFGADPRWEEAGEAWARVEPIAHGARERFDRREAVATHRVTLRFRVGLERGMRLRLGERVLGVLTVHDPDETGRWLVCRCEEAT